MPPIEQRDLRELTRLRSNFIRERATQVNRVHKLLEGANIKLASVATDVMGKSGRAMLDALIRGEADPCVLTALAKGRLKDKREALEQALEGRVRPVHRIILSELLSLIDGLDESISRLDTEIEKACLPFAEAVTHLDTIPGVARPTAELILSEIGADMSRFPTAGHLCAWAGVAPGNNESAGKRLSGKTRRGNKALKVGLVQAAQAAAHTKDTYLSAQFRRLAARRGVKRAIMAVAHSILVIAYNILERNEPYRELGGNYFDTVKPEITSKRLVQRLENLGYKVSIEQRLAAA